jgi:putative peptidoglycan lipid II flippase
VQLLFLLPSLRRIRCLPRPRWGIRDSGVRRIMKLMVPGIIGSSAAQINLLVDTMLASFLVTGSVTWLFYSDRLMEFPLGVFAIALSTVILPSLSRSHANGADDEFSATLDWGLRGILLIGIPSTAGLIMLARPLLATLFQHGDFTAADVDMAGLSLMAYAIGLPGFMLIKVLAPAFYSRKDPRTPVRIAIIALAVTLVLNLTFVLGMLQLEFPGAHAGLALATSLGAWVNAGLLFFNLRRNGIYRPLPGWPRYALQVLLAVAVLSALLAGSVPGIEAWLARDALGRILWLLLWVAAGIAVYFLMLRLSGVRFTAVWRRRP